VTTPAPGRRRAARRAAGGGTGNLNPQPRGTEERFIQSPSLWIQSPVWCSVDKIFKYAIFHDQPGLDSESTGLLRRDRDSDNRLHDLAITEGAQRDPLIFPMAARFFRASAFVALAFLAIASALPSSIPNVQTMSKCSKLRMAPKPNASLRPSAVPLRGGGSGSAMSSFINFCDVQHLPIGTIR
jgi:hypothetical protein